MFAPTTDDGLRREELAEIDRHETLYRDTVGANLRLVPWDWLKFDGERDPISPYIASVTRLGDVTGKRVLDLGCGDGWFSTILAKRGAIVTGFDIATNAVRAAHRRAAVNDVADRCGFATASCYALPYADGAFDVAVGQSILHHVGEKARVAAELHRVLQPGARAVFHEPFGNSLWLERLRRLVPVASMAPDDPDQWKHQFRYSDLEPFARWFDTAIYEFQFLSRLDRVITAKPIVQAIGRVDLWLMRQCAWLRPYARAVVVELRAH
ncbi:MAG TPA: methyltransferase domain-containing protein [Gemmatimonadaceae bacterium]|jgi:SAM-dependent methyltransferase|nr:methyltransferase domain-containing protein [Gemmatimonadaceae bacterium]